LSEPYEALPLALKLRSWPALVTKGNVSQRAALALLA